MSATYQRGIISSAGSFGLIQSFTYEESGERAEALDEMGEVAAFEDYNAKGQVTVEVTYDTATTLPSKGDTLTVTGTGAGSYVCDSVSVTEANKEYTKASIKATRYVANSLPA